ncbi:hypothetical protein [Pseudogracilibacillus sp. SO30301A]|uniref:hypothetical protein n=1 Tax=Pseudogracilibacillus sp. SO30301A TaxID=3098291 RepID=UPI003FA68736
MEKDYWLNIIDSLDLREGVGKCVRYKLGTVFKDDDYLLVVFFKVNDQNEAVLNLAEYV